MNEERYSRRSFVRCGLLLAGVSSFFGVFESAAPREPPRGSGSMLLRTPCAVAVRHGWTRAEAAPLQRDRGRGEGEEYRLEAYASAPESERQQRGGSPRRTEHWLSVAEGNCVAERWGGEQPEANDQSIIKKMINSIRPDALASLLVYGEAQNGSRPGKGERQLRDLTCGQSSERRDRSA
jgi:hypothetical protein